jgi:hypothetical protein
VTGASTDVYNMENHLTYIYNTAGARNLSLAISTDSNVNWAHTIWPYLDKDVQGNSMSVVRNSSDEKGEFLLVRIPRSKLCCFLIMAEKDKLPLEPKVTASLTSEHLKDGSFDGKSDIFLGSLPVHIPFYHRMDLTEGNIHFSESVELMTNLGAGYLIWLNCNI